MIQRWKHGAYMGMFKSADGAWVKHTDHKAIVDELVEALEYVRNSLTDETDKELTGIDFANELYEIDTAIAKAKGVS